MMEECQTFSHMQRKSGCCTPPQEGRWWVGRARQDGVQTCSLFPPNPGTLQVITLKLQKIPRTKKVSLHPMNDER